MVSERPIRFRLPSGLVTGPSGGMVVRWPGKVKAEVQTDAMVEYVDVRTFLDAAGLPIPDDLDGRSFYRAPGQRFLAKTVCFDCKPVEAFTMDEHYANSHAQTDSATSGTSHPRHSGIP